MKVLRRSIVAASVALASCGQGQAGSDYRGEPLMDMNGVIRSAVLALDESLVPAIVLYESPFDVDRINETGSTTHYVQGEVEGTFPSAFNLRVYEPPPAVTLDQLFEGEPAFSLGFITAISPRHPAWLRVSQHHEPRDGVSVQRDEICSSSECYSGYPEECPPGDPDPNAAWPCGNRFPDDLPWASYGVTRDHLVLYVAGPVAAGSVLSQLYAGGAAIAAGYHVLERDYEGSLNGADCGGRAAQRALEALNQENGTQWTQSEAELHARQWTKQMLMAMVAEECPKWLKIVDDTASSPVELTLVDQASTRSPRSSS